jgi:putative photosynthetic complex assembly protein
MREKRLPPREEDEKVISMNQVSTIGRTGGGDLPRAVLVGAASLVLFALVATGVARLADIGTVHMPAAKAVETLALRFEDRDDGGVSVRDADDGKVIYIVAPGTNGFIRATLRGLVRERKLSRIGDATPFTLTHWSDGTLSLEDPATGRHVALDAFGPTNAEAFARLFAARSAAP